LGDRVRVARADYPTAPEWVGVTGTVIGHSLERPFGETHLVECVVLRTDKHAEVSFPPAVLEVVS
jgi:hypothetical protein